MPQIPDPDEKYRSAASGDEAVFFRDLMMKWASFGTRRHRLDFRFGEDSDGSTAVWVTIIVPEEVNPSKETISELRQISNGLRDDIIASEYKRWPYVQIRTE